MAAAHKPGPKPKPTVLRVLEGDHHKSRYNLNEPQVSAFDDAAPERVRALPDALAMWEYLSPRLTAMGILGDEDRYALEALCVTYAMWGMRPSAQMTSKLQSMLCEFGLTPSSRTRLTAGSANAAKPDPIAARLASL